MAQIDLYDAIFGKLTADQTPGSFFDDLGGRINLHEGPQDEVLPRANFTVVTDIRQRFFDGNDILATFQLDIYNDAEASTQEALLAIHEKALTLLDAQAITMANHSNAQVFVDDKGTLVKEEDAWRITSQWRVMASEN